MEHDRFQSVVYLHLNPFFLTIRTYIRSVLIEDLMRARDEREGGEQKSEIEKRDKRRKKQSANECDDLCFIFYGFSYVYFFVLFSCARFFNWRVRFICTFCYLMCFDISHTHGVRVYLRCTVVLPNVLVHSRVLWHLHLAFIYSETINHITSHTYMRREVPKRYSARERVNQRTNQQNQAIPFIETYEWSEWTNSGKTNGREKKTSNTHSTTHEREPACACWNIKKRKKVKKSLKLATPPCVKY